MRQKIFLLFALLCAAAQGAWAEDTYDYPTKTKPEFYASYGGKSNVVVINTEAELAYITEHFDDDSGYDGNKDWDELNYYLDADLDMGENISWLPLGRVSYTVTKYSGTFWGNGHTISYRIWALDEENQGLFSTIAENGKVYDVNVVCNINSKRDYVGGIAGENHGLIQNCSVMATIVEEDNDYVGGIVGENTIYGKVEGCYVEGTITGLGSATKIGGIAGKSNSKVGGGGIVYEGNILNCWVSANISSACNGSFYRPFVGGICGENKGIIQYCCMTGDVKCASEGNYQVGGLAGSSGGSTTHCTFYGTVTTPSEPLSKYIGNSHTHADWFDTFNQGEYDDAKNQGYDLYATAIKNVFAVNVSIEGDGTVSTVETNVDVSDLSQVQIGHEVRVTVKTGFVESFSITTTDGNPVTYYEQHYFGDNYYWFFMPRSDVNITVKFKEKAGDGSEANPYTIASAEEWESFKNDISTNGNTYKGKYVMLVNDIDISQSSGIGQENHEFEGIFDGAGHTLNTPYHVPFSYTKDATIKNLHVTGKVIAGIIPGGSIVRNAWGTLNLINCQSSVILYGNENVYHGGLVGKLNESGMTVTIEGCVFDGQFYNNPGYNYTNLSGFVGEAVEGSTINIRNSLLKPSTVSEGMLINTFADTRSGTLTIENSYFVATDNLPTNQGTQARTITAGDYVTISGLGEATATYGSQGITAYAKGIKYDGTYYAGSGETVTLTLSHGSNTGYTFSQYTATGGTLNGNTLIMPAADVTINADWTRNTHALADNADNTAFITAHKGYTYDVTLQGRTLYKDGAWNTLCLPFDVTLSGSPLEGATARYLTSASVSGTTLSLTFSDPVDKLYAGEPYIIKWEKAADYVDDDAHNIVGPVFNDVRIGSYNWSYDTDDVNSDTDSDNDVTTDLRVRFLGTYAPLSFDAEDKSILLMGGNNTLYYPTAGAGIGAQRAYFKIGEDGAMLAKRLTAFNIDFGDDEATGIISVHDSGFTVNGSDVWYTLDGRKLDGKPSVKGVYVNNGRKVIIK